VTSMKDAKRGLLLTLAAVALVFGLGLSGCLQTSALECMGGTTECNVTCVYLSVDPFNCGGCGNACQPRAICVAPTDGGNLGACECPVGNPLPDGGQTILLCDGACSDITTDPNNCGGCAGAGGTVCSSGQVCAPTDAGSGACETSCGTATECNGACVTLSTDPNNCGACGNICPQGYDCHATPNGTAPGTCLPDAVVACISNTGTVAPIFDSPVQPVAGPGVPGGTVPEALGILGDGLLVGAEGPLGELALENLSLVSPEAPPINASGPTFIEVDTRSDAGSWVYVVDGTGNTLIVLTGPPSASAQVLLPDGGLQGLGLVLDGGFIFGQNTDPQPYARVNNEIFVPLYGGYPPNQMGNGGTVVRLDVTNPSVPVVVGTYDMKLAPLQTFDGGLSDPRPSQALLHEGLVYVVLQNLVVDPDTGDYDSAGPSMLVKIDPTQPPDGGLGGVSQYVTLDAGACLNAGAMAENSVTGGLLVSCFGQAQFDPSTFATLSVDRSAVLSLDVNDVLLASWSPQCPAGGAACTPPIAGPLALVNGRVYVGDSSSGRVFVVSLGAIGQLTQLVGYGPDGGVPLQPCPTGISDVSAIITVP
jgi:hypothetical protein